MGGLVQCVCTQVRMAGQSGCYKRFVHFPDERRPGQVSLVQRGNGFTVSLLSEEEQFMVKRQMAMGIRECCCQEMEEGFCHELVAMTKIDKLPRVSTNFDFFEIEAAGNACDQDFARLAFTSMQQFQISADDLLSCLVDLRFIDSAQHPLWKHFFSRIKVEKVQKTRTNCIFERFSHKVGAYDSIDSASNYSRSAQSSRLSTHPYIFDLRVIMISLYFLSKSKLRDKVWHIVTLFQDFVSLEPRLSNSSRPLKSQNSVLRTDVEILLIFQTMAQISLQDLPYYAKNSGIEDFWSEDVEPTDFENGELANYSDLTSKWKAV